MKYNDLEKEFKKAAQEVLPQIQEQLEIAEEAIENAKKLSQQHGIPFSSLYGPVNDNYVPLSFTHKFLSQVDEDKQEDTAFKLYRSIDLYYLDESMLSDLLGDEGWVSDVWMASAFC